MNKLLKNVYSAIHRTSNVNSGFCNKIQKVSCSDKSDEKSKWLKYNDITYPPIGPDEEPRPAYVCYEKKNIKYPADKMWYVANFVKGMSVERALTELKYVPKKGAFIAIEVIQEAINKAVDEHNVEYKTNLWIAESYATKGLIIKGLRRHAKMRRGEIRYKYCNYYVRLEEGEPPEVFLFKDRFRSGPELLNEWLQNMRSRRIQNSL